MRFWLTAASVAAAIAGSWLLALAYYAESNGFDCYPTCSASQDIAGAAVVVLPIALVLVFVAALARGVWKWQRRRGARPE